MKIAVISPNPAHLQQIGVALEHTSHSTLLFDGGKSRMREIAERELPDLILVDGICCDVSELAHVEHVTQHHPDTAVVLMCSTHNPDFLINSMRAGVREVLPSPVSREALAAAVERVGSKLAKAQPPRHAKILAFMSCKGGSGATFLATNLGWQLAERGRVLLIDLNLQFGNALAFVHDGKPASTIADVAHDIARLDASLLAASAVHVSPSYSVLAAPEDLAQAVEVKPEHVDAILQLAATQYDFVILDVSSNLDTLAIHAFDKASRIFAVIQSAVPDLRNAAKALDAFRSLGYSGEKVELIVNRFEKSSEIDLEHIQRTLGGAVKVRVVPNSYKDVSASINHGEPVGRKSRGGAVTKTLEDFAQFISPRPEENRGLFDRIFRRA